MRKKALVAAVLLVSTGCYSYVPAEFDVIPVGEGVRVYLSREGVQRLREIGGDVIPGASGDQPVVSGTLVRRDLDEFSIRIPVTAHQEGFLQTELGQQVTLPTSVVVQAQRRKVSQVKTALAVVGSTALITGVIISIIKGARQPVDSRNPPSEDVRIPLSVP